MSLRNFGKNGGKISYLVVLSTAALFVATTVRAETNNGRAPTSGSIRIVKVQTAGESVKDDVVVLKNFSGDKIDISGWKLRKRTAKGNESSVSVVPKNTVLAPKQEFVWGRRGGVFEKTADVSTAASLSDNQSLALLDKEKNLIDSLTWGTVEKPFAKTTVLPNPSDCELIAWDKKNQKRVLVRQERKRCQAVEYNGEKIIINELLPDPAGSDAEGEFVELRNLENKDISLAGWKLFDGRKEKKLDKFVIKAGKHLAIWRRDVSFGLSNTEDTVKLIAPDGTMVDEISYQGGAPEAKSYARDKKGWKWTSTPTPGEENKFDLPPKETPKYAGEKIIINELLPNPVGEDEKSEFIELRNLEDKEVSLEGWSLRDGAKSSQEYVFPEKTVIPAGGFLTVYRKNFGFALNNSGAETVVLSAADGVTVDTVSYAQSVKEGVSLNRKEDKLLPGKKPTPGAPNIFSVPPEILKMKIDRKIYRNVSADFSIKARGEGEIKVRWDFGDGHRSYKSQTAHRYEKAGKYTVSVRISDGVWEIVRTINITVEKYPSHKVKIVEIAPNPVGKDRGREYIRVVNKSKRKINLKGWSVATGQNDKKLTNHPIREDLIVMPGKTRKIFAERAAISLRNTEGLVELRRPDGSVSHRKKYRAADISAERKTVPEGAVYLKKNKQWQWELPEKSMAKKSVQVKNKKHVDKKKNEERAIEQIVLNAWRNEFSPTVLGISTQAAEPEKKPIVRRKTDWWEEFIENLNLRLSSYRRHLVEFYGTITNFFVSKLENIF